MAEQVHVPEALDPPATEEHGALVSEQAHGPVHAEPTALGLDAAQWVAVAMMLVLAVIVWKKVPAAIAAALDRKIGTIRKQLDEAATLRAEAEALKAEYAAKTAAADKEAATIVERARVEADELVRQAKVDAEALIERHSRMAEDKIAAAERTAIAEVRAKTVTAAAAAAERLIRDRHDAAADKTMIDQTIDQLGNA